MARSGFGIRVTNDDIWRRANIFVNIFRAFVIYEPLEPLTSRRA